MHEERNTSLLIDGYRSAPDRLAPHAGGRISRLTARAMWCYASFLVFAQVWCVGSALAQGAGQDRRIALIIGNSAYRQSPLTNPVNDAQAMAATLGALGFTVTKLENASKGQMSDAIRKFGEAIKRGGVGLFYYAGHGLQVQGENFLLPVDANIEDINQVVAQGVEAKKVLQEMSNAKNHLNLVILDACRNNPFVQSASRGLNTQPDTTDGRARADKAGGLAPMEALVGTLIAFATAPDSVAADGTGKNGVYTENLLRNLAEPGLKVEEVFKRTRFAVRQETGGRQVPWENTSLEGDFYFVPLPTGTTTSAGGAGPSTNLARDQQAALPPGRADASSSRPPRSPSGFSFSREEEKDRTTRFAKDDEIRARLQAPCPEPLRQRPIVIDIAEESRADGLVLTERSSRFAQLVSQHLQQAGLTANVARTQGQPGRLGLDLGGQSSASSVDPSRHKGSYSIQGVVFSQQGANRVVRLKEANVSAELALRDPTGRIMTMVEVSGATFTGQDTSASARALTKEQASDASSQLYTAFCGAGVGTGRPSR
jgi:hypothetical protein